MHLLEPEDWAFASHLQSSSWRTRLYPFHLHRDELLDGNVTLVVVDMQPGFRDAIDKATLDAVERQILLAISCNWAIVSLEYNPWRNGSTLPQLKRHLDGYGRHMMRVKSTDGGSCQVVEACQDFGYPMQYFRICGVYIDACVKQTVLGLSARLPSCSLRVIREACNTNYLHAGAWDDFPRKDHIVISSELVGGVQKVAA
jgi:hypothetical protein